MSEVREYVLEAVDFFNAALLDATVANIHRRVQKKMGRKFEVASISGHLTESEIQGILTSKSITGGNNNHVKAYKAESAVNPWIHHDA